MSNNNVLPRFDDDTCNSLVIELLRVDDCDTCLTLHMKGQIDTYSSPFFQKSVQKAIDAGFVNLFLVLSGVEYLSSKAVGALVQIQKAARDHGGDIVLLDVHPKIMEVLRLLSLEKYFQCRKQSTGEN